MVSKLALGFILPISAISTLNNDITYFWDTNPEEIYRTQLFDDVMLQQQPPQN